MSNARPPAGSPPGSRSRGAAVLCIAALTATLAACRVLPSPTVQLLTDRAELAAYVEAFNADQDAFQVEIIYHPRPARARPAPDVDVVIADGLAAPGMRERFTALDRLFGDGLPSRLAFYPGLLESGRSDGKQYLLPLSFNLPLIAYKAANVGDPIPGPTVSAELLRERSEAFAEKRGELYRRLGFSPLWNPEFLYLNAVLAGAEFRAATSGGLAWDEAALGASLANARGWVGSLDPARLADFDSAYMNIPEYQLAEDGRILFYLTDAREYLAVPPEKRRNLDFRWFGDGDRIPVLDDILYVGLVRGARNPRGARQLLLWLFQPETQVRLMEINHFKRLPGVFGIAGGFPALVEVSEKELPKPDRYPVFVGHLPPGEMLLAPGLRPAGWAEIRDKAVLPWLRDAVRVGEEAGPLAQRLSGGES